MLYITNKKIINTKKIQYALKKLYGINIFTSKKICKNIGINPNLLTMQIDEYHINRLKKYIKENIIIEYHLKNINNKRKNFLLKSKNIRGIRQHFGLPVRGQRTHSNAKTSKKIKNKK
jgi:small subunit ribosomal protein S13